MLPPVVDVEFYGNYEKSPASPGQVKIQLREFLEAVEQAYNAKPIIYAVRKSYELYIKDDFADYDIWIRDVFRAPDFLGDRKWTFWQYADRCRLAGYDGKERFIDMNVFNGTEDEFLNYGKFVFTAQ
jgi:lysozyme